MKKLNYLLLFLLTIWISCSQNLSEKAESLLKKPDSMEQAEKQARELAALMSPEEKFELVCGNGMGLRAIPRLGIPEIRFTDASGGVRIGNSERYSKTTALPCPQLLAATWDTTMARQYARAIGEECRGNGTHVLLGPGMNILRNSLCGRNFEYVGEDPYLAGQIIASYVKGLQSTGTAATLKHFIGNEAELMRKGSNSIIQDRALHEVYLPPFQQGIDAGALAVMTSYNQLNGEWAGQNKHLVTDILRNELGFRGLVMTDWNAVWNGVKFADSGVDLEMPNGYALRKDSAQIYGTEQIDRMAEDILKTCIYAGFYETAYTDSSLMDHWAKREAVAYKTNTEGIVLLKNNGILPVNLKSVKGKILVASNNATRLELAGGGSAHVAGYNNKSYLDVLQEELAGENIQFAENPSDHDFRSAGMVLLFCGFPVDGENREHEAVDRPFVLPDNELINRAVSLNKNTILCLQTGGSVQMNWAGKTAAILQAFYGGQTGAKALIDILSGRSCPSGKLPYTWEKRFEDSPAFAYDQAVPYEMRLEESDRIPTSQSDKFFRGKDSVSCCLYDIHYDEGIFVGYRWYDRHKIAVRFPFGHGLSYTSFEYSNLKVTQNGESVLVSFDVKNSGERFGDEVAQVYVSDRQCSVERPEKELKAFERVTVLPGETRRVELRLLPEAFRFWDEEINQWLFEPGEFIIQVGASSQDIRLRKTLKL